LRKSPFSKCFPSVLNSLNFFQPLCLEDNFSQMPHKRDVRNVNKCLPLARTFTKNKSFVIWVSNFPLTLLFWLADVRKKYIFTVELCSFRGEISKRISTRKYKTPNKLKVTILKQVSKNLLPDKV